MPRGDSSRRIEPLFDPHNGANKDSLLVDCPALEYLATPSQTAGNSSRRNGSIFLVWGVAMALNNAALDGLAFSAFKLSCQKLIPMIFS